MFSKSKFILLPLAAHVFSTSQAVPTHRSVAQEPCAEVSGLFDLATKLNSSSPIFPGDLVHKCLTSMPFDPHMGVEFVEEYKKYVEFLSTVDILKDPPSTYLLPGVNLPKELNRIQQKAKNNGYKSQFDFDSDVSQVTLAAHDGHFSVQMCSSYLFEFINQEPLVSVSVDGKELPRVYTQHDAKLMAKGVKRVSPVTAINGTDVTKYLEGLSLRTFYSSSDAQDPDALYNGLFPSNARSLTTGRHETGAWTQNQLWPGSSYSLRFENGTQTTVETLAKLVGRPDSFHYKNGSALFNDFCKGKKGISLTPGNDAKAKMDAFSAYPKPFLGGPYSSIAGFLLNSSVMSDAGILAVPTFQPLDQVGFSNVAKELVANASSMGRTKMIVDLTANSGGYLMSAANLFKIFFPQNSVYTGTRLRAHDGLNLLGKALSGMKGADASDYNMPLPEYAVTPDQKKNFSSWEELYGPHETFGMNSTTLMATQNLTAASTLISPISGFGPNPLDPKKAAFKPENILLITDGNCASACAIFVKLMKDAGAKTIAFGGRPKSEQMQTIGGTRGGLVYPMETLSGLSSEAYSLAVNASKTDAPTLTPGELQRFNQTLPNEDSPGSPLMFYGTLNVENMFGRDNDQMPLQFTYEAADCRRFFTAKNYMRQESIWEAAVDAVFGNGGCVGGDA